jgi:serine/threonine protein kinase
MTVAAGAKLGPYEIVGQIGAGGMGEVYRAKDPRLGRDVAIKESRRSMPSTAAIPVRSRASIPATCPFSGARMARPST